jgi:hypothetical protein
MVGIESEWRDGAPLVGLQEIDKRKKCASPGLIRSLRSQRAIWP